jgi:uncharacterized protein with von Willebrand factor type A (vWA) domain
VDLIQVISNLEIGVEKTMVGALSWSDSVDVDFHLDDHISRRELYQAVNSITYVGNVTYTSQALSKARLEMFNSNLRPRSLKPQNVLIVITDGNSNVHPERTAPEAVLLHQSGIYVMTVSIGTMANQTELAAIATRVSNPSYPTMFSATSQNDLDSLADRIPSAFCEGWYN